MSAVSLADKKRLFFEDHTGLVGKSVTDLEWNYYSSRSGLTPVARYSLADHKRAYFEVQTGFSGVPLSRLERQFFGADTGESLADAMSKFFFSPREYPGLELALDASLISGLADGAAVAQWDDKSGKGRHLVQATAAARPLYRSADATLNNRPAVEFDGTDDVLKYTASTISTRTVYLVGYRKSNTVGFAGAYTGTVGGAGTEDRNGWFITGDAGTTAWFSVTLRNKYFRNGTEINSLPLNSASIWSLDKTSVQSADGAQIGQDRQTAGRFWHGLVSVVYVYSVLHDDKTRRAIERALGEKYGIVVA